MAQKKKTTKAKKLHPGGSVPTQTTVGQLNPLNRKPRRAFNPKIDRRGSQAVRRALKLIRQRQRVMNEARRRFGQPTMPTAGISQGRPVRGLTPMPGPAPDPARQRRMDNLMREAQRRFNQQQRNRAQVSKATTLRRKTLSPVERTRMENARKAADRMLGRSRPTPPRDGTRRGRTSGSR